MGGHTSHGYPVATVDGERVIVRRIFWQHHYGPIPDGVEVLRTPDCRFLDCVELAHLYLADAAQRIANGVSHAIFAHGEQH